MADEFTGGLAAAVAGAVEAAGPARLPLADVEALDLFTDPAKAAADPKGAARAAIDEARRRGRPRGASNKRTAKWRDYLAARYAHPLEVLAQTYSRHPAELAAELNCTILEAFQLQLKAAAELAPFMECKMPTLSVVAADSGIALYMPGFNAPIDATLDDVTRLAELGADFDVDTLELEVLPAPGAGAKVATGESGAKV